MRTVGIDLASQDDRTAACVIDWQADAGLVTRLVPTRVSDTDIVDLALAADKVGVDVPFGWPIAFAEAVARHSIDAYWPVEYLHADNKAMCYRATDLRVKDLVNLNPLSVSSDRIALPAMRTAALMSRLEGRGPLDGTGRFVEVYPAAALHRWGLTWKGYKDQKPENRVRREVLVRSLLDTARTWLRVESGEVAALIDDDNALDAFVAALIARAAAVGLVEPVPDADRVAASREGWIAIPLAGSLSGLTGRGSLSAALWGGRFDASGGRLVGVIPGDRFGRVTARSRRPTPGPPGLARRRGRWVRGALPGR